MARYGLDKYGLAVYGDEYLANLFYGWMPNHLISVDQKTMGTTLERFCAIFSYSFWETKKLIDKLAGFTNIDTIPIEYLPYYSALIGLDYNYELTESLQRTEVKMARTLYSKKGTEEGIRYFISRLTGWGESSVIFQYGRNNTLMTNTLNNLVVDTTMDMSKWKLWDDPIHYVWDTRLINGVERGRQLYEWGGLKLWLIVPEDDSLSTIKLNKIARIIGSYTPINIESDFEVVAMFSENYVDQTGGLSYTYSDDIVSVDQEIEVETAQYKTDNGNNMPLLTNFIIDGTFGGLGSFTNSIGDKNEIMHVEFNYGNNLNYLREA